MAQQKIFKSRLSAKDLIKFNPPEKNSNNNAVSSSPRWQYYSVMGGSQRIVVSSERQRVLCSADHFASNAQLADRKHVTRVSVNNSCNNNNNNKQCYQSRSLSDLRLLPDVTSSVNISVLSLTLKILDWNLDLVNFLVWLQTSIWIIIAR